MAREARRRYLVRGEEAMERLAELVGHGLVAGTVVALDGELGAGKTTWARGLARGLGVLEPVSSPTFILMHEYAGRLPVRHFDAWMQGREEAFLEEGGATYLGPDGVALVEWAERVEAWLPRPRLAVRIAPVDPGARRVELEVVPGAEDGELGECLRAVVRGLPPGLLVGEGSPDRPGGEGFLEEGAG